MKQLESIVLVDDDHITNMMNLMLLKELEVAKEMFGFADAERALRHLIELCLPDEGQPHQGLPDLILVDLNMPGMDGFEFLQRLSYLPVLSDKQVYVYILTTSDDLRDTQKAGQFKLSGYIIKPLTAKKVQEMVAKINGAELYQ